MAVQQIMEKAFLSSLEALHEKGISPSADLTPVYVGKFCYIGKLALDEYYPIDERILGVAALVLTGVISWEKGWGAFKWVPEFILPVALDKSIGFLTNCYSNSTDRGREWKSEKDRQRFILTSAIANGIFKSLGIYLMRSRNPKIFLRSAIPLMIATIGYSALFQGYAPTISQYIKEHYSKKYSFKIVIVSNTGLYLLFSYVIGKGIEKVVGAPILSNRKVTIISAVAFLLNKLLVHSPNSPFKKTQE